LSPVRTSFVEEVGGSCITELQKWAEAAQKRRVACLQLPSYCWYIPRECFSPVSTETTQALGTWLPFSHTALWQRKASPLLFFMKFKLLSFGYLQVAGLKWMTPLYTIIGAGRAGPCECTQAYNREMQGLRVSPPAGGHSYHLTV